MPGSFNSFATLNLKTYLDPQLKFSSVLPVQQVLQACSMGRFHERDLNHEPYTLNSKTKSPNSFRVSPFRRSMPRRPFLQGRCRLFEVYGLRIGAFVFGVYGFRVLRFRVSGFRVS